MKIKYFLFSLLCVLLVLPSCKAEEKYLRRDIFAMNTFFTIEAETEDEDIIGETVRIITDTEKIFSKTITDSDISIINNNEKANVSMECAEVLSKVKDISEKTQGYFNPCIGKITELWDITGKMYIPTEEEIHDALLYCESNGYSVEENTVIKAHYEARLDLGACIKGYVGEKCIEYLRNKGVTSAVINAGGNVTVLGKGKNGDEGWSIGLKNPFYPDEIVGIIKLSDTTISVSGDYERFFEKDGIRYHHIFDPFTGKPCNNGIKSVAVICKDGLVADSLSTALFVMGKDKAIEFYGTGIYDFEAIIISDNGEVTLTEGIRDSFSLFENSRSYNGNIFIK